MGKDTDQKIDSPTTIKRTPNTTMWIILASLAKWYQVTWPDKSKSADEIMEFFLDTVFFGGLASFMTEANLSGKDIEIFMLEELEKQNKVIPHDPEAMSLGIHSFVQISCGYCIEAFKAENDGDINLAWTYLTDASYWAGIVIGSDINTGNELVKNARKAANARHSYNRKRSEKLINHFLENRDEYPSKNKAAYVLSELFHLAPKTIREKLKNL